MCSERGAKNLKVFNAERESRYIPLIKNALKACNRKMKFESLGALATHIGAVTGIHRTTLSRSTTYRKLLLDHLFGRGGLQLDIGDRDAPRELLQTRLLTANLENSNLNQDLKKAQAAIVQAVSQSVKSADTDVVLDSTQALDDYYSSFVDTAMALIAVLERYHEFVALDLGSKEINDEGARPSERLIVGPQRLGAFVKFVQSNPLLLSKFKS